jgi:hypothetical protein
VQDVDHLAVARHRPLRREGDRERRGDQDQKRQRESGDHDGVGHARQAREPGAVVVQRRARHLGGETPPQLG